MSENSIRRIFAGFEPRIAQVDQVGPPDRSAAGMALLTEFVAALARDIAETVFLTSQTTPGLTQAGARHLADESVPRYGLIVTEMAHHVGGTLDMALSLTDAATEAYAERLAELSTGQARGGVA